VSLLAILFRGLACSAAAECVPLGNWVLIFERGSDDITERITDASCGMLCALLLDRLCGCEALPELRQDVHQMFVVVTLRTCVHRGGAAAGAGWRCGVDAARRGGAPMG
jgi:hypothetical protein